jgi:hypothetical protein
VTLLAYKFALLTPRQERALRSHAGAARGAFNTGLTDRSGTLVVEDLRVAGPSQRETGPRRERAI